MGGSVSTEGYRKSLFTLHVPEHRTTRVFTNPFSPLGGSPGRSFLSDIPPSLSRVTRIGSLPRALREHILIVCTLPAKGTVPASAFFLFFPASFSLLREGGLIGLPLRASNEGLLRPRVARAQETNRPPSLSPSLDCPFCRPL